jgi:hypothetical protein
LTLEERKPKFGLVARGIRRGDGVATGEFGQICIAVWRKDSTLARFELQRRALADFVDRSHGKVGFCCVVEANSGVPNEEVRNASSKLFDCCGDRLGAIAMVIEGAGFRSALVRSVTAGIVMVMGKRTLPISYLATVTEGAAWLQRYALVDTTTDLEAAVESVRAAIDT